VARALWGIYKWGEFKWGQLTTAEFLAIKNRTHTEGHLLLEIDLVDRTLYLSDEYRTVTSTEFEGLVTDWGGIDTDREISEGLSGAGDARIKIANTRMQFMTDSSHGNKFSDLFDDYFFDYRTARIKQWFEGLNYVDAELIFTGEIVLDRFNQNEVEFVIFHQDELDTPIPLQRVNKVNHPFAPSENVGAAIPIPFGDLTTSQAARTAFGDVYAPMVLTDNLYLRFDICPYQIKSASIASLGQYRYVEELDAYIYFYAPNKAYTNDSDGAYLILNEGVQGTIDIKPRQKGSTTTASNYENSVDDDTTTYTTVGASQELSVLVGSIPELGKILDNVAANIRLDVTLGTVSTNGGDIGYNNTDWQGAGDGKKILLSVTSADSDTLKNISFATTKDKKGSASDQSDQYLPWTWQELGNLEFYVTAGAGESIQVKNIELHVGIFIPISLAAWNKHSWGRRTRRTG
jgi:hypothetical protein